MNAVFGTRPLGPIQAPHVIDTAFQDVTLYRFFSEAMRKRMFRSMGSAGYTQTLHYLQPSGSKAAEEQYRVGLIMLYCAMDYQRRCIEAERKHVEWKIPGTALDRLFRKFSTQREEQVEKMRKQEWRAVDLEGNPLPKVPSEPKAGDPNPSY